MTSFRSESRAPAATGTIEFVDLSHTHSEYVGPHVAGGAAK